MAHYPTGFHKENFRLANNLGNWRDQSDLRDRRNRKDQRDRKDLVIRILDFVRRRFIGFRKRSLRPGHEKGQTSLRVWTQVSVSNAEPHQEFNCRHYTISSQRVRERERSRTERRK